MSLNKYIALVRLVYDTLLHFCGLVFSFKIKLVYGLYGLKRILLNAFAGIWWLKTRSLSIVRTPVASHYPHNMG